MESLGSTIIRSCLSGTRPPISDSFWSGIDFTARVMMARFPMFKYASTWHHDLCITHATFFILRDLAL